MGVVVVVGGVGVGVGVGVVLTVMRVMMAPAREDRIVAAVIAVGGGSRQWPSATATVIFIKTVYRFIKLVGAVPIISNDNNICRASTGSWPS